MIYFDNAATTAVDDDVLKEMFPYFQEQYGNPSAIYSLGRNAKKAIQKAREQCAKSLNCKPSEVYFTSGGSESDNWIVNAILANGCINIHTSEIEHKAVLRNLEHLKQNFYYVNSVPTKPNGIIDVQDLLNQLRRGNSNDDFVSVMWVNNELGTIQPIEEISKVCAEKKILFHTDAVQAAGKVKIDLQKLNGVSMLSISGHKIGAPKGIGLMFIREGVEIDPLIVGGYQEKDKRAGTENVAGIVGLGKALEKATNSIEENNLYIQKLKDRLVAGLKNIPNIQLNGFSEKQLPNFVNISFKGIEAESLVLCLDIKGVCVSGGAACNSGSLTPSYVLKAIGVPDDYIYGTIRITLSEKNTISEVETFLKILEQEVKKLRNL